MFLYLYVHLWNQIKESKSFYITMGSKPSESLSAQSTDFGCWETEWWEYFNLRERKQQEDSERYAACSYESCMGILLDEGIELFINYSYHVHSGSFHSDILIILTHSIVSYQ